MSKDTMLVRLALLSIAESCRRIEEIAARMRRSS